MSHTRGQPAPEGAFSRIPLRPVPVPGGSAGLAPSAPHSTGGPLVRPAGVSWHVIGVGVAFCLLLITGLVLGALALRPREAASLEAVAFRPEPQVEPPTLPISDSQPAEAEAKPGAPAKPGPTPFAVGMNGGKSPRARGNAEPQEKPAKAPFAFKVGAGNGEPAPCETYGTSVHFVSTPREAAQRAALEQKLVFTLHVSGNFEDPAFT